MKKFKFHPVIYLPVIFILLSSPAPANEKPLIFPFPQQMEVTGETFSVDETLSIIVPRNMTENDIFIARFLVRELSDKYRIAVKIEESSEIPSGRKVVIMGRFDNPLISKFCKANKLTVNAKDPGAEGYLLQVSSEKIIIAGSDNAGVFYGLQSLRQLLDHGNGRTLQGLKVKDWPAFPFRAIRLYVPGPENIAFFKRFMRDFMSLYKYNKVGWYEIVYEDGYLVTVPVQYGVNILEMYPGAEDRLDENEGETGSAQNLYAYNADPVKCSDNSSGLTFYAFEWVNQRYGKKIKEVNIHGTVNYQATQTDYGKPVFAPLKNNAIILAALSKVKKREITGPVK